MNIEISGNKMIISGEINTISSVQAIKEQIKTINPSGLLTIQLQDATIVPSSLLGIMLKIVQVDGIEINLEYKTNEVGYMLESLNLISVFKARKI